MKITDCFTEGKIGLIDGTMGSGKTDFACTLMENLIQKKQFQIITNIIFLKKEENVITCSTAKNLLLNLVEIDKTVVILDEAGLWFNSKEALLRRNKDLEKLVMLIRKFRSNLIFIAQSYRYVPPIIKDFYNIHMSKQGKTTMMLDIREEENRIKELVKGVWHTSLSFDTYSIPFFSFDIDIEKLFIKVATIPSSQIKEVMKTELTRMDGEAEEKIKPLDIVDWLIMYKGEELSDYEISDLTDVPRTTVNYHRKKLSALSQHLLITKQDRQ